MFDLLIKNGTVIRHDRITYEDIAIKDGKYAGFFIPGTLKDNEAKEVIDASGKLLFPGIIDCHAHLNEPGFEYREDFETGSRAAAIGGTTSIIDMPLNQDPPLISKKVWEKKFPLCDAKAYIDYGFWGGLINNNYDELEGLQECGVLSFKGFTCPNGDLFPAVNMGHVRNALELLKKYDALCGFHCEEYGQLLERTPIAKAKGGTRDEMIRHFLDNHDVYVELAATNNILDMARATGARVHICHVTHPMVAEQVRKAQYEGVRVTAETCPHYLGFNEDFVFEKGVPAKCTPPIRSEADRQKLWDYVLNGTLSCIGSDHSPAADHEKDDSKLSIWQGWGGLNCMQWFVPMAYDLFVNKKGLSPTWISKVMDYNPAKIFGLYGRKGAFEVGFDGDVLILDPEIEWEIDQSKLVTKGHVSCFHGYKGKGKGVQTIIRGRTVAKDGMYLEEAKGYGTYLTPVKYKA